MTTKSLPVQDTINRWKGILGRELTGFEQMKCARPFRYDSTDRKWYRVVKPVLGSMPFGYIEIDLNMNPGTAKYDFNVVVHNRGSQRTDHFMSALPDAERAQMANLHGHDLAQWILYGDIWVGLDVTRMAHEVARNAGIRNLALQEVLFPEACHEHLGL